MSALREAVEALLSNEEHATSGGMRSYAVGSPTWELWESVRQALALPDAQPVDAASLRALISKLNVASCVIGNLPELSGYNGSILKIDDDEAERIAKDIDEVSDALTASLALTYAKPVAWQLREGDEGPWCDVQFATYHTLRNLSRFQRRELCAAPQPAIAKATGETP